MPVDLSSIYTHEMHHRLLGWGGWARGNKIGSGPAHVLARLIRQKIDDDYHVTSHVDDFTLEYEACDKAVARIKATNPQLKRLVMRYYISGNSHPEIAQMLSTNVYHVHEMHFRALELVDYHWNIVHGELKAKLK